MIDHARFNRTSQPCIIEGCTGYVHAKGYCRKHYGQIWRRGEIYEKLPSREVAKGGAQNGSPEERRASLGRELRRAEHMYAIVVGLPGRLKWRAEIQGIKLELAKLD